MALTQNEIDEIFAKYVANTYNKNTVCTLTKSDIKTAVTDTETWINTNKTSFNNALNATFRSAETTNDKSFLFFLVAKKIFDNGG